jgi:hypothetical protein
LEHSSSTYDIAGAKHCVGNVTRKRTSQVQVGKLPKVFHAAKHSRTCATEQKRNMQVLKRPSNKRDVSMRHQKMRRHSVTESVPTTNPHAQKATGPEAVCYFSEAWKKSDGTIKNWAAALQRRQNIYTKREAALSSREDYEKVLS